MQWTVAQARQRFSELLREAAEAPQLITNRDRPVAAVVDGETFRQFQAWQARHGSSLYDSFQELRRICDEEDYELIVPERSTRVSTFPDALDELSAGH